ncbi:MAG TPA: V-type ATP synthase subunit C [Firmicutes bacterium]|nr:V-type ATP synthase subunit C [Bacillota bacterium]
MNGDKTEYAYSVARVRALETGLLDRGKIERMVEARDAAEALKVLGETPYAAAVGQLASVYDYESMLRRELVAVRALFWKISPHPELTDLFFLKYDVLNLKLLLKGRHLGQKTDDLLVAAGTIGPERLAAMAAADNWKELPAELAAAAHQAGEALAEEGDPQLVDTLLDKAYYAYLTRVLGERVEEFLRALVSLQVDLTNIKTFVRVRHVVGGDAARARALLPRFFLPGGRLALDYFLAQVEEPLPALADRLAKDALGPVVGEGITAWQREKSLTRYEKLADDFLLAYVKKSRLIAFGVEPLVAYLMAKENEIKLIRIIMVGKINGLPAAEIRERLRDVYA